MKLAVIYDSKTNNTAAVAGYMADGMNSIEGVEAKTFMAVDSDSIIPRVQILPPQPNQRLLQ